jgi:hypothetical protein
MLIRGWFSTTFKHLQAWFTIVGEWGVGNQSIAGDFDQSFSTLLDTPKFYKYLVFNEFMIKTCPTTGE